MFIYLNKRIWTKDEDFITKQFIILNLMRWISVLDNYTLKVWSR